MTWQLVLIPQVPRQGSTHLLFKQALFRGHSELTIHSGLQFGGLPRKPDKQEQTAWSLNSLHWLFGPQGVGLQGWVSSLTAEIFWVQLFVLVFMDYLSYVQMPVVCCSMTLGFLCNLVGNYKSESGSRLDIERSARRYQDKDRRICSLCTPCSKDNPNCRRIPVCIPRKGCQRTQPHSCKSRRHSSLYRRRCCHMVTARKGSKVRRTRQLQSDRQLIFPLITPQRHFV